MSLPCEPTRSLNIIYALFGRRVFDQYNTTGTCVAAGAIDPLGNPIDGCWLDESWAWLLSVTPATAASRPEALCATARVPPRALFTVVLQASPPPPPPPPLQVRTR